MLARLKVVNRTRISAIIKQSPLGQTPAPWRGLIFWTLVCLLAFSPLATKAALDVHIVDVGQGDAILIRAPEADFLIDAGLPQAGQGLVQYLQEMGVAKFDAVFMTHPHADHIGGMKTVLETFSTGVVVDVGYAHPTSTYEQLLLYIDEADLPYQLGRAGKQYGCGVQCTLEIVYPEELDHDINASSMVLLLTFADVRFLFTGDIPRRIESKLLAEGMIGGPVNVLQSAHHGSQTSSSLAWLQAMSPRDVFISAGRDNTYGHPHESVLARLGQVGANVYLTAKDGHIVFTSDGLGVQVSVQYAGNGETSRLAETDVPFAPIFPDGCTGISLNYADKSELMTLPGIGTVLADRILAYRESAGPLSVVEELLNVSGIGEKRLEALDGLVHACLP